MYSTIITDAILCSLPSNLESALAAMYIESLKCFEIPPNGML